MRTWSVVIALFISVAIYSSVTHIHGIVGVTKLNGEGCVCHDFAWTSNVNVRITGPDSVLAGSLVQYRIRIVGGPGISGGFNVAARAGALSVFDSTSVFMDNELTHNSPKLFSNDTVSWTFNYRAPNTVGWDTIYSVGLSANRDSMPTTDDKWNFGPNFPVKIVSQIPVELSSFSASTNESSVILTWVTVTETNNRGFEIYRNDGATEEKIGFVKGAGNSSEYRSYSFADKIRISGTFYYVLKQIDFDGSFRNFRSNSVDLTPPAEFLVYANYPNPFNPETSVSFSIPVNGNIKSEIFNSGGELVETIVNSTFESGYHKINWYAKNRPSGIYYCKIDYTSPLGSFSRITKLVLAK